MVIDDNNGIAVSGRTDGLSVGTDLAFIARFSREDGLSLGAAYYEIDQQSSAFLGVNSYRGGALLYGQALNADGEWGTLVGANNGTNHEWSLYEYTDLLESLTLDPEAGISGTPTSAIEDAGAGYGDALIAYRSLPVPE
jgi:hypothetical protein